MDEASFTALAEMIDHAYAATSDPQRWSEFSRTVSEHFRGASTALWCADQLDDRWNVFASHRYEPSAAAASKTIFSRSTHGCPEKC